MGSTGARDFVWCALVLLQLVCAAYCNQAVQLYGGRRQLRDLPLRRGLSTDPINNSKVLRASLIHRDFLETSVGTNRSTEAGPHGRFLEAVQRSRRRAAQLTSLHSPLSAYPQRGEYVMQVSLGTPPQKFTFEADTGSDLCWVHCSPCGNGGTCNVFDPTVSSTYTAASCTDPACAALSSSESCSADGSTCLFIGYSYGDKSSTAGDLAYETFTLDSAVSSIAFGCGVETQGFDNVDGLIGLGTGPLSLPSQLAGAGIANIFSYCLVDTVAASQGVSSQLTFGDAAGQNAALVYTPMLTDANGGALPHFYVGVTGVSVGGVEVTIDPSVFQIDDLGNGGVILDSGTTLTLWPDVAWTAIANAFQQQITYPPVANNDGFQLCYDISGVANPSFPGMVVHMTNFDFAAPGTILFQLIDATTACLFMGSSGDQQISIIGNVHQRDQLVVYDSVNQQIGFQTVDCKTLT